MPSSKAILATAALFAGALAQTSTKCNPLAQTCPPNPAFGNQRVNCDLTKSLCSELKPIQGTYINDFSSKGALFSITQDLQGPSLVSDQFIFFGRVDVTLQAAPGAGIVTSVVLISDDLDEIDWEFIGNHDNTVQTNIFSKGDQTAHDLGEFNTVSNPFGSMHTYTIEWTKDAIKWIIDGNVIRTLTAASIGNRFPQSPMHIRIGTWVGGSAQAAPGTVEWAGGPADFSKAPFNAWYKDVKIVDYAGGSSPAPNKVNSYSYGDRSGSWESIKFDPAGSGNVGGKPNNHNEQPPSSSSSAPPPPPKTTSTSVEKTSTHSKTSTTHSTTKTTMTPKTTSSTLIANTTTSSVESTTEAASTTDSSPSAPAQTTDKSAGAKVGVAAGAFLIAAGVNAMMNLL